MAKKKAIFLVIAIIFVIISTIILYVFGNKKQLEIETEREGEEQILHQIKVINNNLEIVFELNESEASKDLLKQLPLTIEVENYSNNEKIFYPKKLSTNNTPLANPKKGTLAYYAPWGDVVMYYDDSGSDPNLYELGKVIFGEDNIEKLSGRITILIK